MIEALALGTEADRCSAAQALGKRRDGSLIAVGELILALQDESANVCEAARSALDQIGERGMPAFLALLRRPERVGEGSAQRALMDERDFEQIRSAAAFELTRVGGRAVPSLLEATQDANPEVRQLATASLGAFPERMEEVVPTLKRMLSDPESGEEVVAALESLAAGAKCGIESLAGRVLVEVCEKGPPQLRETAARSVEALKSRSKDASH